MLRRHPHLLLEECAKIRSIGEAELIGNLLNIFLRILQQRDTLTDNRLEYKFLHRIPTDAFGKSRKVFRRQTEFIRIEFHTPFLHTYGNKANPSSCNSLYDDVENPELRAIVEKVAATTPYREEASTNEAQSPPNPLKRISGKQRKATLEEYQQTFLQVPRIDDPQASLRQFRCTRPS